MTVYVAFKEGVYRHECLGVFSTQCEAEAAARAYLDIADGYHGYSIFAFVVDVPSALDHHQVYGDVDEGEPVARQKGRGL